MRAGISTATFYPELTEASLTYAAQAGAVCTEIFINALQEFSPAFFKRLKQQADALGIQIVAIHPFTSGFEPIFFFSDYPRRFEDGREMYRRFFSLTGEIGAPYFVLHGPYKGMKLSDEEAYDRFGILYDTAAEYGVTLLQENVARCKTGDPAFLDGMRRYLKDRVGFVLDTKQARRAGFTEWDVLAAMGGQLRHVHLSDYDEQRDCIPPGTGCFDLPRFLLTLQKQGYTGDIVIELYQNSYKNNEELLKSYHYLQNQMDVLPKLSI